MPAAALTAERKMWVPMALHIICSQPPPSDLMSHKGPKRTTVDHHIIRPKCIMNERLCPMRIGHHSKVQCRNSWRWLVAEEPRNQADWMAKP